MHHSTAQIPFWGILIFFTLYIIAATYYPGGNQVYNHQQGFDWFHNYWCDLLETNAINGLDNPAKPIALFALFLLCFSLGYFFMSFPKHFPLDDSPKKYWSKLIRASGVSSMLLTTLIATSLHNYVVLSASLLGLLALMGIFISLRHHKIRKYLVVGWFAVALLILNNVLFYSRLWEWYLPFLQKLAFAFMLFWFAWISYELQNTDRRTRKVNS